MAKEITPKDPQQVTAEQGEARDDADRKLGRHHVFGRKVGRHHAFGRKIGRKLGRRHFH